MGKQKRSENTYQKINTLFKRDINNIIMPYDGFVDPAFEWLKDCKFECSEKVDGTNVRFEVISSPEFEDDIIIGATFTVQYKGKTDNANLPKMLEKFMKETYTEEVIFNALGIKKFVPVSEFEAHKWGVWGVVNEHTIFTPVFSCVPKMYTIFGEGCCVKF